MIRVVIAGEEFSPEAETADFAGARKDTCGALVSFVGYCRGRSGGERVDRLELQHYLGFTETEIGRIANTIAEKHGVADVLVIHRVGVVNAGEPIVLVAVSSAHRAAAFAATEQLMDFLKTDAPFWKREIGAFGSRWIEPTADDYARRREHEP
jgi:molybdopterin synthase catalytic subunit